MSDTTTQDYDRQLRELLDSRMTAGHRLAEAASAEHAARAAHEDAARAFSAAFSAALSAGWSERELRAVFKSAGQVQPVARRTRTSSSGTRRRGVAAATPEQAPPASTHGDSHPAEVAGA